MAFDVKQVKGMDRVVAVASAIALLSMFLPWYGVSAGPFSASVSGFGSGYGWLGAVMIVAAGVYTVLLRSGSTMRTSSIGPATWIAGLSVVGTLLVIVRWLSMPSASIGAGFSYGPRVGIILALVAGLVQVVASIRLFRRSGERVPWSAKQGQSN